MRVWFCRRDLKDDDPTFVDARCIVRAKTRQNCNISLSTLYGDISRPVSFFSRSSPLVGLLLHSSHRSYCCSYHGSFCFFSSCGRAEKKGKKGARRQEGKGTF